MKLGLATGTGAICGSALLGAVTLCAMWQSVASGPQTRSQEDAYIPTRYLTTNAWNHPIIFPDSQEYLRTVQYQQESLAPRRQESALVQQQHLASGSTLSSRLQESTHLEAKPNDNNSGALQFAWNMLRSVVLPQSGNTVLCPILPQTLLANLYDVASPGARTELRSTLHASYEELQPLIRTQLTAAGRSLENQLDYAMIYFLGKDMLINQEFRDKSVRDGVAFQSLDFRNANTAAATANQWVMSKTRGAIREILSPASLDQATRLVMASVIYFKGKWKYQFTQTKSEPFAPGPGRSVQQVPMMYQFNKLRYGEIDLPGRNGGMRWVELPYEGTGGLSMVLMLPQERHQLESAASQLTPSHLMDMMEHLTAPRASRKVHLRVPRFEVYSSMSLVSVLKSMGLRAIFDSPQALQGMSNEQLVVRDVTQRTFVSVDEQGTTATSAASLSFVALSAGPVPVNVNFTADEPFIVMIVDKINKYPMFVAKIESPSSS
ncbi:leukocyte elastase inhibitor-like [Anopheles cruzii]|uniref:leukocyte elastase inhibitor-like n=1 Tax=Anopheles cruzii TaxID=68878 RepID=UPI0022EC8082|nr:leukocyte elastase inhibitor-like [Anopheles cruzii]XP_052868563.1 leukocyte elastase inhibitor-like [Anopheles cruzii]